MNTSKVFISHVHEDNERCGVIIRALREWGVDYWIDREDLHQGQQISQEIQRELDTCDLFIRVCSVAVQRRPFWVDLETDAFRALQAADTRAHRGDTRRIIPLILDQEYVVRPFDRALLHINAVNKSPDVWLEELRHALGIPTRAQMNRQSNPNDATTLGRMLKDMHTALDDEIAQVKRAPRGHDANSGVAIGMLDGQYLYTFSLVEPWDVQEDMPLAVRVPRTRNGANLQASVVTCTGTKITISSTAELPAEALAGITLVDDKTSLLKALQRALDESEMFQSRLGSKAFSLEPPNSGRRQTRLQFPGFRPNSSQTNAIELSLGSEVSYVIGPPGTGKTITLAAIVYALLSEGRTVLVASHTNIAVDNAILELAKMCEGTEELRHGRIIRYGAPNLPEVRENDFIYPPRIAKRVGKQLEQQRVALKRSLDEMLERLERAKSDVGSREVRWMRDRAAIVAEQEQLRQRLNPLLERERLRKRALEQRLAPERSALAAAQQALQSIREQLGQMSEQHVRLEIDYENHAIHEGVLRDRLDAALRMKPVVRLFRRINVDKLKLDLADAGQQSWHDEQALKGLDGRIDQSRGTRASAEQHVQSASTICDDLIHQLESPSPDAKEIAALSAAANECAERLAQGDADQRKDANQWRTAQSDLQRTISELKSQIGIVDAQLLDIEKRVVAEARVIATTLTKIYMAPLIRDRRFDAVVLDEVSIAPMPAAYIAASHADKAVTLIGDSYQLSPIKSANTATADKWLGTDLFTHVGVSLDQAADGDGRSVLLNEQRRMDPKIAELVRCPVYHCKLENGPRAVELDYSRVSPAPGFPVVVCDTSDANPISPKGKHLNEYHIMCTLEMARQALLTMQGGKERTDKGPRIGIVTPYKDQAQDYLRRIKKEGLDVSIRAGTIHRFQGLQFEVVIFDTVECHPSDCWFTRRPWGTDSMRLTNVAVTRAQHKLIIVANVAYLEAKMDPDATLRQVLKQAQQPSNVTIASSTLPGMSKLAP